METIALSSQNISLIERAKLGDSEAFTEIYENNYSRIYSYIYYRVDSQEIAEDLASDVFVRLVKGIHTYRDKGRPIIAWLYTIAGNLVRDYYRKHGRIQLMPIDDREIVSYHDPAHQIDLDISIKQLKSAIRHLTADQAQVIILKFIDGLSNRNIANVMGKPEGSIKSLQHRALRSLRKTLEQPKNKAAWSNNW